MSTAITVEVLPAGKGDALWIECHRPGQEPWRLVIDGGVPASADHLLDKIEALAPEVRHIDLVVVSHLDNDHIGGLLSVLARRDLGVSYGDIWFNGFDHLPHDEDVSRSHNQAEDMMALLHDPERAGELPWNQAFDGNAVTTGENGAFRTVSVPTWPSITLLGPDNSRLQRLRAHWEVAVGRVTRGEPEDDEVVEPGLTPIDVEALVAIKPGSDYSRPNQSSIAFLLEHRGATALLTGDSSIKAYGQALFTLSQNPEVDTMPIDLFKLPHHGSNNNVNDDILGLMPARHYVVCTSGAGTKHPDDECVARIVKACPDGAKLVFNYRTARNERWEASELRATYCYDVLMPSADSPGVVIELPARDRP